MDILTLNKAELMEIRIALANAMRDKTIHSIKRKDNIKFLFECFNDYEDDKKFKVCIVNYYDLKKLLKENK